jgi:two-component sensor histidine kinase
MKPYSIPTTIMASVCLTICFYEFFAWSRRGGPRRDIAFAVTCLGGAVFNIACSGEYSVDLPIQSLVWLRIQSASLTLTGMAFLWFVSEETGLVGRRYFRLFLLWSGLGALSQIVDLGDLTWVTSHPSIKRVLLPFGLDFVYKEVDSGPITDALNVGGIVLLAYLLAVVHRFARAGHRRQARYLFGVLGCVSVAYLNDFAVSIGLYSFIFTMEYAWLVGIILVGLWRSNALLDSALARLALQESEEALRVSLEEKNLLLREIHHRVKNNLQLVSSLLYLQARRVEDPDDKAVIQDCRSQIGSMALIHEDLYRSRDFRSVDFGSYLRTLVGRLLAGSGGPRNLSFAPVLESLNLGIDQAIPCGLIANELCTNALKHAFPEGFTARKPEIRVELRRLNDGRISFSFADNGVGLPENFDPGDGRSFGMKIIAKLVEQIGGELRIERGEGLRFVVDFPVAPEQSAEAGSAKAAHVL